MAKSVDFAPISGERSLRLRIAAGYLRLSGFLTLGLLTAAAVAGIAGNAALRALLASNLLSVVSGVIAGLGLLVAARDLSRKLRRGGYGALFWFAAPVVTGLVQGRLSGEVLVTAVLGVVAVASAWEDLE